MSGRFMKLKKIVIPMLTAVIIASSISGCALFKSNELVDLINAGQTITIEVAAPNYDITVLGVQEQSTQWTQLDQLKTYNDFRIDFDTILNINKITVDGINSKSGSLYVTSENLQSGNTSMQDAFRNKVFMTKYWSDNQVTFKMAQIAGTAYTDVEGTSNSDKYAAINAYYDLLTDNVNPDSFNATQSVSREQFYAFIFKATHGVQLLKNDTSYTEATGGETDYSLYAQQEDEFAFLNVDTNSLDKANVSGSISRAEAVYMIVNKFFSNELSTVDGKAKTYSDCKNAGDLAAKVGFKTKENGAYIGKQNWQSYILAYMMQNPNKGMQQELYKAMVVAGQQGLLGNETESRWDEPISKAETLELMANVFTALNKRDGYLTTVEYGTINEYVGTIFQPDNEGVPNEEPVIDWEEPPVTTVYNSAADTNNDGHVDKGEWEQWVKAHPEDLNKDLHVSDEEQAEYNKPTQNNNGGSSKPTTPPANNNSGNNGNTYKPPVNNGGSDNRTEAQKKADEEIGGSLDDFTNWDSGNGGNATVDDIQKPFRGVGESDESWQARKDVWNAEHPDRPIK